MKINELIGKINALPNYRADSSGGKIYVYTTGPDDNCFMEFDCNDSTLSNAEFNQWLCEYTNRETLLWQEIYRKSDIW